MILPRNSFPEGNYIRPNAYLTMNIISNVNISVLGPYWLRVHRQVKSMLWIRLNMGA